MTSIYRDILPSILPTDDILVEDEEHRYVSQERPDGSVFTQQRYQLNKAPIDEVQKVKGEVDGKTYEFQSGQDYELDEKEFIDFSVGGQNPDVDTEFYVTYVSSSILDRYIEGHEEEIETVADKRQKSIDNRFVDRATGTELEKIGSLFGSLGERRGRDDNEYRLYLKSLVQSFSGRGRKEDIKFAVASAFGSGAASFRIKENFEEVEYIIELDDWPLHKVGTLVELLELADPSGVELGRIEYNVDEEQTGVNEGINITVSTRVAVDNIGFDDNIFVDKDKLTFPESISSTDNSLINPKLTEILESLYSDDTIAIPRREIVEKLLSEDEILISPDLTKTVENLYSNDKVDTPRRDSNEDVSTKDSIENVEPVDKNKHRWETTEDENITTRWSFFEWTEIVELSKIFSENVSLDDSNAVNRNLTIVSDNSTIDDNSSINTNIRTASDNSSVNDSTTSNSNKFSVGEELQSDDENKVNNNLTNTVESSGSADSFVVTSESVLWGESWDSFQWAGSVDNSLETV